MSLQNAGVDLYPEFDLFNRQMQDIFSALGVSSTIRRHAARFPLINIGSTEEAFEVVAFAPGVAAESLQATIEKGLLTISGERPSAVPKTRDGVNVYAQERSSGAFRRAIELPQDADTDQVTATYSDGCLRVSIRKRESSRPRLIDVK